MDSPASNVPALKDLTSTEYLAALKLMEQIGGGFVSSLAKAWRRADGDNSQKLELVFGDILCEYAKLAKEANHG